MLKNLNHFLLTIQCLGPQEILRHLAIALGWRLAVGLSNISCRNFPSTSSVTTNVFVFVGPGILYVVLGLHIHMQILEETV